MYTKIRHIPFPLQIKIIFGEKTAFVGWMVLAIGLLFSGIFLSLSDFSNWRFKKNSPRAQAIITKIEFSNARENKKSILAYHYEFDLQGIKQVGVSYGFGGEYKEGDEANVIFLEKKPEYSRIENLRKKPFGQITLFVLIFPLIGGLLIFFSLPKALRKLKVLREGVLGEGVYLRTEPTNVRINRRVVMRLFFELQAGNKTYQVKTETHRRDLIDKLTDGTPQKLLYLPQNPEQVVFLNNITGNPTFRADGSLADYPLFPAILYLSLPITCFLILWSILA